MFRETISESIKRQTAFKRVYAQGNKFHPLIKQEIFYEKEVLDLKTKYAIGQFTEYLQQKSIFNPRQYGFRPGVSTENALHIFLNDFHSAFSRNSFIASVFFLTWKQRLILSTMRYC